MTKEQLGYYVFLNNEITKVEKLMENFEANQPFLISAGDSETVSFSIADETDNKIQSIRQTVRTYLIDMLSNYKRELTKMFENDEIEGNKEYENQKCCHR